jgi:flavin reductase (DIM6/NTAB) family NADH-FMN oxidoreductase RutF
MGIKSMGFDQRAFRDVLGQFATGIAVITAQIGDVRLGATVTSFNTVSLEPPLILFSLARSARSLADWKVAPALCVSILSESQIPLSNGFARAGGDKWAGVGYSVASSGCPILDHAIACFECAPYATYDGGDHEIFVLRVTGFHRPTSHPAPLIFYGGKYRNLKRDNPNDTPADDIALHGW